MDGQARDIRQIFGEKADALVELAGEGRFGNAFRVSAGLTRMYALAGFKRGVLMSETLEGVFADVGALLDHHVVPNVDKAALRETLAAYLVRLKSAYGGSDAGDLYGVLEDIRLAATLFHFKCEERYSVNPEHGMRRRARAGGP